MADPTLRDALEAAVAAAAPHPPTGEPALPEPALPEPAGPRRLTEAQIVALAYRALGHGGGTAAVPGRGTADTRGPFGRIWDRSRDAFTDLVGTNPLGMDPETAAALGLTDTGRNGLNMYLAPLDAVYRTAGGLPAAVTAGGVQALRELGVADSAADRVERDLNLLGLVAGAETGMALGRAPAPPRARISGAAPKKPVVPPTADLPPLLPSTARAEQDMTGFARAPDGGIEFGRYPAELGGLPIRLFNGHQDAAGGSGLAHIDDGKLPRILRAGFSDSPHFVGAVGQTYDRAFLQPNGRIALVAPRENGDVLVTERVPSDTGDYASVITAIPSNRNKNYANNLGELVWDGRPHPSTPEPAPLSLPSPTVSSGGDGQGGSGQTVNIVQDPKPLSKPARHYQAYVPQYRSAAEAGLPMEPAERLARAVGLGFDRDGYWTGVDVPPAFEKPPVLQAGPRRHPQPEQPAGVTLPAKVRMNNPLVVDSVEELHRLYGDQSAIRRLQQAGYDGLLTRPGADGSASMAPFRPHQVRSRFAAFDPAKTGSGDLLATVAPIGSLLGLASIVPSSLSGRDE